LGPRLFASHKGGRRERGRGGETEKAKKKKPGATGGKTHGGGGGKKHIGGGDKKDYSKEKCPSDQLTHSSSGERRGP